jgi:xylan 1,4-beta-xylosidase
MIHPGSKSFLVIRFVLSFLLIPLSANSQQGPQQSPQRVNIEVQFDQPQGMITLIWNYFGYDEPNYTYAPNGKKLLGELAALAPTPAYVRIHNLLTTGDGSASLKWGSTNVYTEDAAGNPVYSWTILDRIFDTFQQAGVKPLVEIGFMPEALSTHPETYRHNFPQGSIFTGWAYPPKDYQKWSEVVFQFVRHLRERYGDAEVRTWLWEIWNEPDIDYWKGTPQEYFKLSTISVWTRFCARFQRLASAVPTVPDPVIPRLRIFCGRSSTTVPTSQIT